MGGNQLHKGRMNANIKSWHWLHFFDEFFKNSHDTPGVSCLSLDRSRDKRLDWICASLYCYSNPATGWPMMWLAILCTGMTLTAVKGIVHLIWVDIVAIHVLMPWCDFDVRVLTLDRNPGAPMPWRDYGFRMKKPCLHFPCFLIRIPSSFQVTQSMQAWATNINHYCFTVRNPHRPRSWATNQGCAAFGAVALLGWTSFWIGGTREDFICAIWWRSMFALDATTDFPMPSFGATNLPAIRKRRLLWL